MTSPQHDEHTYLYFPSREGEIERWHIDSIRDICFNCSRPHPKRGVIHSTFIWPHHAQVQYSQLSHASLGTANGGHNTPNQPTNHIGTLPKVNVSIP